LKNVLARGTPGYRKRHSGWEPRTAVRKSSIGRLYVGAEGLDVLKLDKTSTDL